MCRPPLDELLIRRMGWSGTQIPTVKDVQMWQLAHLRGIVAHAKAHSPFYRNLYSGIIPERLQTLADYATLPTISPDDVRNNPMEILCVSQDEIARVVTLQSSGTTGPPKRIFHTVDDLSATLEFFAWGMQNLVDPGQTALVLMGGERPGGVGRLLCDALARSGARGLTYGEMTNPDDVVDRLLAENVDCIVSPSAHVNMVARAWQKRGLPQGKLRSVLLCWDMAPQAVARNVADIFGCDVLHHWGMIETGLGGAVECGMGTGMHLRETDVFMEIVDPSTGTVLPDGEYGEMVVSTPLKYGMPLLRYRTGDIGRIVPGQCVCGSPSRRLDSQVRRMIDGVVTRCGTVQLSELNEVLYALEGVWDFSATLVDDALVVTVCGEGAELARVVRAALLTVPVVENCVRLGDMQIRIAIRDGSAPAVPGLGKRRLQ